MSQWEKIRKILNEIRKTTMISTPVGKILAINTAMFVLHPLSQILWRFNPVSP